MGEFIDVLLQMSRTSRCQARRKRINLSKTIQHIAHQLLPRDSQHNVHFTITDGIFVNGDLEPLAAVLENLMDNACKFTS